jgi:GNAT superfamily N-acetyltransferase
MLTIEKLKTSDRAQWETLFRAYIDFYERSLESAAYDHAWSQFIDDEPIHARGARLNGRLVGIAHFLAHPHTNAADVCYLQDLFTAPDVRGQGVGRALIENVTEWARERGCSRVLADQGIERARPTPLRSACHVRRLNRLPARPVIRGADAFISHTP